MKKVRYAIGAIGAVPALGLVMTPAAHAAPAHAQAAQPARDAAKRVSLTQTGATGGVTPAITCGTANTATATANGLHALDKYTGTCVHWQQAWISHSQTGLTEHVQFYSRYGTRIYQAWRNGTIFVTTSFWSTANIAGATRVCQTLVANANHADVKYGPVCEPG